MFAFGDKVMPGLSKLVEEIGELGQVLGKYIQSRGSDIHWSGNLRDMLHDEVGDVLAAISFITAHWNLDITRINERAEMKRGKFDRWHAGDNDPVPGATK